MKKLNKKKFFNSKVKTKSLTVLLVTFLLSAFLGTLFVGEASAAISYTQYTGSLDGADWALRIPEPWNGMLVVLCRGYGGPIWKGIPANFLLQGASMLEGGFAIATTNYGSAGFCIQAGMDSTYQLTNYVVDNYGVTGKVFLYGRSMGGQISLLLGDKYPSVYSGVLDVCGVKDFSDIYTVSKRWSTSTDEELAAELTALGIPVPPPGFESLDELRENMAPGLPDMELETGGTPATQPEAYEDRSPRDHASIEIPVITVHGTFDVMVPFYESTLYEDAVAKAYRSDLYRLYGVVGGWHLSDSVVAEVPGRFNELVEWSNELTGAADWPMFGYDPQRSGYTTSSAPTTNQTLWIQQLSGMAGSSPAVVAGKVYAASWSGVLHCYDAATGDSIWNFVADGALITNPSVSGGRVYFGSNDTNIYCVDALTGAKIWSYKTGANVYGGVTVAGGKVYAGSEDDTLYCLRADYGQVEWKFTTGGDVHFASVADGKVYAGSFDGSVYCLDAASSTLIWRYSTGGEVGCAVAVADGKVYFDAQDDYVYCLDAMTGTRIWRYETGGGTYSSPVVADGNVFIGSDNGGVYCLDAETGELIWNYAVVGGVYGAPAVADGKVYVGSIGRRVYCFDAETGAVIWSYLTNGSMYGSPVVANGVAYVINVNGQLIAFSAWAPIPESLTLSVMLLLSTIAVIVSMRYYRKRPKWKNW